MAAILSKYYSDAVKNIEEVVELEAHRWGQSSCSPQAIISPTKIMDIYEVLLFVLAEISQLSFPSEKEFVVYRWKST